MKKLLFINLYGTILPEKGEPVARKGAKKFLESLDPEHSAVYSYEMFEPSRAALEATGLFDSVPHLYGFEEMSKFNVMLSPERGFEVAVAPNLIDWSRIDFKSRENNAIVISNKPSDIYDAYWSGAVSIEVPTYKDISDTFSFERVKPYSFMTGLAYAFQDFTRRPRKIVVK